MKKFFYVAAAFLAAGFVSCSENEDSNVGVPGANDGRLPILFSVTDGRVDIKQNAPATRGTGAVGDVNSTKNIWNGEKLNVYMFNQIDDKQKTLVLATDKTADSEAFLFENAEVTAPKAATASSTGTVYTKKYYPMQGNFDFFAYHGDDAVTTKPEFAKTATGETDSTMYVVPVKIDGSQDLMVAKAALKDGEVVSLGAKATDFYSAYSARKGVHPNFIFKHLLTRFTFQVKAAADVNIDSVTIKGVEVLNANTEAEMVIAYTETPKDEEFLKNQKTPATVYLKNDNGAAFVEKNPSNTEFETIGESLMLMPQDTLEVVFRIEQLVAGETKPRNIDFPVKLIAKDLGIADKFEAGKQYNVKLTLYGLSEILLKLELEAWKDGGDINVDDDAEKLTEWLKPDTGNDNVTDENGTDENGTDNNENI